ncbi:MAG: hypothetical protein WA740_01250 [Candidatus Binataceae bacterium]
MGGPNFTNTSSYAPKCPFRTLQQHCHMTLVNPEAAALGAQDKLGETLRGAGHISSEYFRHR